MACRELRWMNRRGEDPSARFLYCATCRGDVCVTCRAQHLPAATAQTRQQNECASCAAPRPEP